MNRYDKLPKSFLLVLTLLLAGEACFSQDTDRVDLTIDTTWKFSTVLYATFSAPDYLITHSPTKEDSAFCITHVKLTTAEPTEKNHRDYYSLACSLWELNRRTEAEKMFLKIISSNKPFFVGTYYHSSDIPGDTLTNSYGYGSYTSNYKNYACRYLTKIYVEEKKFEKALKYIELADKKYTVEQNCGTGYLWYRSEIDGLYGLCYEGLGKYDSIIDLYLPQYSDHADGILTRALKKIYSRSEINEYLEIAEQSMVCVADTFQSSSFLIHGYGTKDERTTEIRYTSGTATMCLFGRQVILPAPNLENGESVSRELFVKNFKESGFYRAMTDNNE
jgi:hypothetical protein